VTASGVMATVLLPLPDTDFDVTEVAVPWKVLTRLGHRVVFVTEGGDAAPAADPLLLDGVLFGKLGAADEPKRFYEEMLVDDAYRHPGCWSDVDPSAYDGLILPGGHAPGMRQYLGSAALQAKVSAFWELGRPIGAICHGVLVLARSTDPATGTSVLFARRTTCLTKRLERTAYWLTAWKLGHYYRTYPRYVEDEVRGALRSGDQLLRGPLAGTSRGTDTNDKPAFVVTDGNYISARWPGDAYLFAKTFSELLASAGGDVEAER
jgi:putative intracellular protease/amidase